MSVTHLPYTQTGFFNKLVTDYIDGNPSTQPFYDFTFDIKGFEEAITYRKSKPVNRTALVEALQKQYANTTTSALTLEHINLLGDDNTFTITTGHQLCLLTGPLYVIYKLIDTITLSRKLKDQFPQYSFVPVYWMHTEDSDIEEINHAHLFGKKLHWDNAGEGTAGSILTQTLHPVIDELAGVLGTGANADFILQLVKDSYLNHTNLTDATRHFVNRLLGEYGLVILDPNTPELKQAFVPFLQDELVKQTAFKKVEETNKALTGAGYGTQVNPREINLFYIDNNQRYRLVKTDSGFASANNEFTFSAEELTKLAAEHPERFSPNVVLRPLYQEVILPNIAYIGGGGELAYWLQYKAFFNAVNYKLPVLVLRNSFLLIEEPQSKKIEKWGVKTADLFLDTEVLIKGYMKSTVGNEVNLSAERSEAAALFAKLSAKALPIEPTLAGNIEAENKKLENMIAGLEAKLLKALKTKDEATINQIRKLKGSLFPDNSLQERHANFIPFYLKYGKAFFDMVLANADVFNKEFTIINLD